MKNFLMNTSVVADRNFNFNDVIVICCTDATEYLGIKELIMYLSLILFQAWPTF